MTYDRGLALGVFDLFHVGHLRYLQFARRRCRRLIVAVASDAIGATVKGKKPVIPEAQRLELIRGLDFVDEANLVPSSTEYAETAAIWISEWGIDHVISGGGWEGSDRWRRLTPLLAAQGISVEFAPETEGISTTQILESIHQRIR
jgi:glycerol-3-phosphate cytidylyltransferase